MDESDQAMIYPPVSHDEFVARLLIDIWTLATGRTLRDVPPQELSAEELIEFWSDDNLAENGPSSRRSAQPGNIGGRARKP
jgi:hypothetical protein